MGSTCMQENKLAAGHLTRHVVQLVSLRDVVLLFPCTIDSTRLLFKAQISWLVEWPHFYHGFSGKNYNITIVTEILNHTYRGTLTVWNLFHPPYYKKAMVEIQLSETPLSLSHITLVLHL